MRELVRAITECIRFELNGKRGETLFLTSVSAAFLSDVYHLAKRHDVAHLVGDALIKNGVFDRACAALNEGNEEETAEKERLTKLKAKCENEIFTAVYRCENFRYEKECLSACLERAGLPFVALKGTVLRAYYPEEWMRTSCDIDILVHEEDAAKAEEAIVKELGYRSEKKGSHDISLFSPSGVHLELHYTLIEEGILKRADGILSEIWAYTKAARENSAERIMQDEAFYFYHIAHTAKHFVHGGCGLRPVIDQRVLDTLPDLSAEGKERRKEMLVRGGLEKFAGAAEELAAMWFGEKAYTAEAEIFEDYLVEGGVYGSVKNRVAVQQVKKKGKFRYALSRIFLPYDTMKYYYPVLQKHKWLLPFCEVRRWGRLLFKGGAKRSLNELTLTGKTSKDEAQTAAEMLKTLDLAE